MYYEYRNIPLMLMLLVWIHAIFLLDSFPMQLFNIEFNTPDHLNSVECRL